LRKKNIEVLEFDIPEYDVTRPESFDLSDDRKISHVFHLAGKTYVPESWKDPYEFYKVNVLGTVNVLEFCRQTNARLTYLSSYLYGDPDYLPIDENHPLKAANPYGHSKLLADNTCQFYLNHHGVNITILRAFNVYGPGQNEIFLIPKLINQFLDPGLERVEVFNLLPKRDFVYIDDLIHAIYLSLTAPSGIYNVGSGSSVSVEEVIRLIQELSGNKKDYHSLNEVWQNEIFDLYADISKIKRDYHWAPTIDIRQGLALCLKESRHKIDPATQVDLL
ncbi:MAG: GDP-mannose 4,6-dehydratase, partial [Bacteroidia bacterium]|nr:GDP-mannose 4,6-dehydratase [Bacteroidia bacterium]